MNNHVQLPFSYRIRRSHRAKKTRIVVTTVRVEVVAPLLMPDRLIRQFVYDKQGWIIKALNHVELNSKTINSFAPENYQDGAEIPYQGGKYKLSVSLTQLKTVKVKFNQEFSISLPRSLMSDQNNVIRNALLSWMKRDAKKVAQNHVLTHSDRFQLVPGAINIRAQKSRWGSCGIHNDLNLNWVLLLAPSPVFEYVVVHELCHIRHRNHSREFWALVAAHLPEYKKQKTWLNQHGSSLMLGL